ncbi:MAG: OmpA family protein [Deltaproteobacteria bacterium]|nr:OmpA family protein [Deltaproteobacteria bacterium]
MHRALMAAALTISLLGACGIPEEQHNAVIKDMEKCKKDLADTKTSLASTEADLKQKIAQLGGSKDQLARSLGATKKELEKLRAAQTASEARAKVFKQLLSRLRSMIDAGKLQVEVRKGRMLVKMSDKILFDPGKTKLKDDGKSALEQLAGVLKDISNRDFLVAGHTDNVPIKTKVFRSNWELSTARAVEVVKFLQEQGVDPKHLGASGYSEYDPVGDNSTDDGKRTNRRIEIVLMPNIEELPAFEQ